MCTALQPHGGRTLREHRHVHPQAVHPWHRRGQGVKDKNVWSIMQEEGVHLAAWVFITFRRPEPICAQGVDTVAWTPACAGVDTVA
eukprot:365425-Chlamydomonas_euryale.AAC.3